MLMLFSDRLLRATPFTGDSAALLAALEGVAPGGNTSVNDHLYLALKLLEERQGRRVIVLFTDGADLHSVLDMDDVMWKARRSQALIYWIVLLDRGAANTSYITAWRGKDDNARQLEGLARMTEQTGARVIGIRNVEDTEQAFREILSELREQYVLGFYPSEFAGRRQVARGQGERLALGGRGPRPGGLCRPVIPSLLAGWIWGRRRSGFAGLTTFGMGARRTASPAARILSMLRRALGWAREHGLPAFVLGGGSNLLVAEGGFRGLVIQPTAAGITLGENGGEDRGSGEVLLAAEAGAAVGRGGGGGDRRRRRRPRGPFRHSRQRRRGADPEHRRLRPGVAHCLERSRRSTARRSKSASCRRPNAVSPTAAAASRTGLGRPLRDHPAAFPAATAGGGRGRLRRAAPPPRTRAGTSRRASRRAAPGGARAAPRQVDAGRSRATPTGAAPAPFSSTRSSPGRWPRTSRAALPGEGRRTRDAALAGRRRGQAVGRLADRRGRLPARLRRRAGPGFRAATPWRSSTAAAPRPPTCSRWPASSAPAWRRPLVYLAARADPARLPCRGDAMTLEEKAAPHRPHFGRALPGSRRSRSTTRDPFTLLVAVLLSAQTTDKKVNEVTPALFAAAPIRPRWPRCRWTRSARSSARSAWRPRRPRTSRRWPSSWRPGAARCRAPSRSSKRLPGVGHKTASVVMAQAFGEPAFPVDTHIHRLAARWGLSERQKRRKNRSGPETRLRPRTVEPAPPADHLLRPRALPRPLPRPRRLPDLLLGRQPRTGRPGEGRKRRRAANVRRKPSSQQGTLPLPPLPRTGEGENSLREGLRPSGSRFFPEGSKWRIHRGGDWIQAPGSWRG